MNNRGQTLPAWFTSIALTLIFALLLNSYGQLVAFQFRAQSAADSAAAAIVAQQAQAFNQMTVALHAGNIEEFRIRQLLEAIRITASQDGGCRISGTCNELWHRLTAGYRRSLERYSDDVSVLSRITATMNIQNEKRDAAALIQQFNRSCTDIQQRINGLDCGNADAILRYHLVDVQPRLNFRVTNVVADAQNQGSTYPDYDNRKVTSVANPDVFIPIAVEVAVCVELPPLLKVWPFKNSKVATRGASTAVLRTNELYDLGTAKNPLTGSAFQSTEQYGDVSPDGKNWYNVDFSGNPIGFSPRGEQYYRYTHSANTMLQVGLGWWGGIAIAPFTGPIDNDDINQKLGDQC